jgi:hypothetical protein
MTKSTVKPSDRGRNSPEPGPTPGTRSTQRGTANQLDSGYAAGWELEQQERLPPRGQGSIHNQGDDHGTTIAQDQGRSEAAPAPGGNEEGLHSGGTRGPSNQANTGGGTHSGRG